MDHALEAVRLVVVGDTQLDIVRCDLGGPFSVSHDGGDLASRHASQQLVDDEAAEPAGRSHDDDAHRASSFVLPIHPKLAAAVLLGSRGRLSRVAEQSRRIRC